MKSPGDKIWLVFVMIIALMLACTPTIKIPAIGQSAGQTPPAGASDATGQSTTDIPGEAGSLSTPADTWLEATIALRSVAMDLVTTYASGEVKTVSAQIDPAGNVHLSLPAPIPEEFAKTPDATPPGEFEVFIIDGKAYTRFGADTPATPDDSYLFFLADTLSGPEGPGLWLSLVPENDFLKAGAESTDGFDATAYAIAYLIDPDTLAGTIQVDNKTGALVRAELTVPAGLFYPPDSSGNGDVSISFSVQKEDIPAIVLP